MTRPGHGSRAVPAGQPRLGKQFLVSAAGALSAAPVAAATPTPTPATTTAPWGWMALCLVLVLGLLAVAASLLKVRRRNLQLVAELASQSDTVVRQGQRIEGLIRDTASLSQQLRDQAVALEKMAYEDDLSGLPNRRAFDEALGRSVARAQRGSFPLSLLLLEVPAIRAARQSQSDAVADLVVCDIGELLRRSLRASDMPARLQEQTFAVLLHDTNRIEAEQVQQRLGRLFEQFDGWGGGAEAGLKVGFASALVELEATDGGAAALCQRAEGLLTAATAEAAAV